MYTNNRDAYRETFFQVWNKHLKKLPMEAVEKQLVEVILMHPEYQVMLEKPAAYQKQEFELEENPFFHMSLHMAIHDQLRTGRPAGVKEIYHALVEKTGEAHQVEHVMMSCLAAMMAECQQSGEAFNEENYLQKLRRYK